MLLSRDFVKLLKYHPALVCQNLMESFSGFSMFTTLTAHLPRPAFTAVSFSFNKLDVSYTKL